MKFKHILFLLILFFLSSILALPGQIIAQGTDPDINIRLRFGPDRTSPLNSPNLLDGNLGPIAKYHFGSDAEIDSRAPQLNTMLSGADGAITGLYQLHERDGVILIPSNGTSNWGATLVGFSSPGTGIKVPQSGYNIGGGYQVSILYMEPSDGDITLTYTAGESGIVRGYSMHFLGMDIPSELVELYQQGQTEGKLVALPCGYEIGRIRNELWVSIRDTGTFFDARSAYDWWQSNIGLSPSPLACDLSLPPILITPGQTPGVPQEREYSLREIACHDVQDPEYHSLRPYPASPTCNQVPDGIWQCGQDLIVRQTFTVTPGQGSCRITGANTQDCDFNVSGGATVFLNLASADFPFAGNTELVPNAVSSTSTLSDPQRVNNYVSWYLNGVFGRAEEFFANAGTTFGLHKIINYSGPLRKLLPQYIQTQERIEENNQIGQVNRGDKEGRHNQIIECGGNSPVPCYDNPDSPPQRYRISQQGTVNETQFSYTPFSSTEDVIGRIKLRSNNASMPNVSNIVFSPTLNQSGDQSEKNLYFPHLVENKELSGMLQRTFLPEIYRSNDTVGSVNTIPSPDETGCVYVKALDNQGDSLYGERQLEGAPSENRIEGGVSYDANFSCTMSRGELEWEPYVECLESGDHDEDGNPTPATEFRCRDENTPRPQCSVAVPVALSVEVQTPTENETIWNRLVGAHMSVFRRVFPKTGLGTPVEEIEDIPGKTNVTYGAENFSSSVTATEGIAEAGNPGSPDPGGSAELYFPHLGSISEYFLNGVQEALRPRGISSTTPPGGPGQPGPGGDCSYAGVNIDDAVAKASAKYGVPQEMLQAVSMIESLDYRVDPEGYQCQRNFAKALGLMQVTDGTYNLVTCPNERIPDDAGVCSENSALLSRCEPYDAMELAARVILSKIGEWNYSTCTPTDTLRATDIGRVYRSLCNYYGSCQPDRLTANAARGFIPSSRWRGGDAANMGYADIVCAKMAMLNPSLNYCSNSNNYPPRP